MKPSEIYFYRERLEANFSQSEQKRVKNSKFLSALHRIWQHLLTILTKGNDLQVWQTSDRFGNTWWNAYDPATGRSTSLASEAEMRVWIEERYYR
jgi:hypothetical protein